MTFKLCRIRVNAISPGSTDTSGFSNLLASSPNGEQRRGMVAAVIPLERLATPDEIAKAAAFFISDDSGYITGGGFAQVWVRSQARGCQ